MNSTLIKFIFTASFLIFIFSAIAKILRVENADTYLLTGLIASYLCFGYMLYSLFAAKNMKSGIFWLIGLFIIGWPVMLIYVFISNKKSSRTI